MFNADNARRIARLGSLVTLDVVALTTAVFAALALKDIILGTFDAGRSLETTREYVPFAGLVMVLLFARSGLYSHQEVRPGLSRIIAGLFQTAILALVFAEINGLEFQSYYIFYGSLLFAAVLVSVSRLLYDRAISRILRSLGRRRRAVLVGTGPQIEAVAHALSESRSARYEAVGFASLTPLAENGLRNLGPVSDLPHELQRYGVDEVIIADPDFPEDRAVELVDQCHRRGVGVRIAPSTMGLLVHRGEFVPGEPVPLFELRAPVFEGADYALKRSFDFVGAALLLVVLAPALAGIALAIKLTSRGPVLYRCMRPGILGEPFACLKFRTMIRGAEAEQGELEPENEATGPLFKIRKDPRTTAVGALLRRFSLDELPQLVNVLRGEMSLVGPRPLPLRDYRRLEPWHRKRYLVLPGVTGLWQVSGRSDLDFDDLVRLDFLYLERWSVFLDITILLKTIPAVLLRRGAY